MSTVSNDSTTVVSSLNSLYNNNTLVYINARMINLRNYCSLVYTPIMSGAGTNIEAPLLLHENIFDLAVALRFDDTVILLT